VDPEPVENTVGENEPGVRPDAKPCPSDMEPVIESVSEEGAWEGHEIRVRQCEHGVFFGRSGFFVVGSIGQPDDSQSEEGWSIFRFVVDENKQVLALGPPDGAGWMTGVATGQVSFADLDGDQTDEIIEVIDEYFDDPMESFRILKVWRIDGEALTASLTVVLEAPEIEEMEGEVIAGCRASFTLANGVIRVDASVDNGNSEEPEAIVAGLAEEGPYGELFPVCLYPASYEYRLVDGEFRGTVVK
jgi:hypothetical protein